MLLDNLARLNDAKNKIRTQSLTAVATDAAMLDHAAIIETWMDVVLFLATQVKAKDQDHLTIQCLGVRLFNSTACALDLVLSGFYQNAAAQIRDVLEINYLLADFCHDLTLVARWRDGAEKDRKDHFKPVKVRQRIDTADGFTAMARKKVYDDLSKYGAHPTPEGNVMLMVNGLIKAGPFFDAGRLTALLEELTKRLSTGVLSLSEFFHDYPETLQAHRVLQTQTAEWRDKYLAP